MFERVAVRRAVAELSDGLADRSIGTARASVEVGGDPLRGFAEQELVSRGGAVLREGRLWLTEEVHTCARTWDRNALVELAGNRVWRRGDLVDVAVAEGLAPREVSDALREGDLVEITSRTAGRSSTVRRGVVDAPRIVSAAALERFLQQVLDRLDAHPAGLGELRDLLGLSRSDALCVLEYLDQHGMNAARG